MSNPANLLQIVQLVNALLGTANELGLSWERLREQMNRAKAEGRAFSLEDLEACVDDAEASLARLRKALDDAKTAPN